MLLLKEKSESYERLWNKQSCWQKRLTANGTGSMNGDEMELQGIHHCELAHANLNATKSIGHGVSSVGVVEVITTLLQMKECQFHPTESIDLSQNQNGSQIPQS